MENDIVIVKFLTPYKVVLVGIVLLYCNRLMPAGPKMEIMRHIVKFIDPQQQDDMDPGAEDKASSSKSNSSLLDADLNQLEKIMDGLESGISGLSLFDLVLDFVFGMTSLDSLHGFMAGVDEYLVHLDGKHDAEDELKQQEAAEKNVTLLKVSSLLGSYCKRCFFEFDGLSFDGVITLWQSFEAFRSTHVGKWKARRSNIETLRGRPPLSHGLFEEEDDDDGTDAEFLKSLCPPPPVAQCIASEDLETLLEFQIGVFERYGGTLPNEIRQALGQMVATNKPLPASAHYVQYLDAFKDKDYEASFEHLHRYYDYTMNSKGRTHYQYALFTLGALQAEFGFHSEAIRAIEEAITVARENKDTNCLNYILSWFYSFLQSHPDCKVPESLSSQDQISQFLRSKANQTSYALYSLSFQSEVEQIMTTEGALTSAFEAITKSTYINAAANSTFAGGHIALVSSSVWTRCGNHTLANLALDMYSQFPERQLNALLKIEIGVRKAKLLFQEGRIRECFQLLGSFKKLAHGSQWHQHIWYPKYLLLHLAHKLNEMKLEEARFILDKLDAVNASDSEVTRDTMYLRFIYEYKLGNTSTAMQAIWDEVEAQAEKPSTDIAFHIKLMHLYAWMMVQTDMSVRATSLALKIIKRSEEGAVAAYACKGVILLAQISIDQDAPSDAMSLIDAVMPRVSCGDATKKVQYCFANTEF